MMKHTPYGYDIVDGKAVINEEKAEKMRALCENYLSGMSMAGAAKAAGIKVMHSSVKRILQNPRYLGDDFYPAILTAETVQAVEEERIRRASLYKGNRYTKDKGLPLISTEFTMEKPISSKYKDPIKQAEYAYRLIKNIEESEGK